MRPTSKPCGAWCVPDMGVTYEAGVLDATIQNQPNLGRSDTGAG
jgi:hypothetical protein